MGNSSTHGTDQHQYQVKRTVPGYMWIPFPRDCRSQCSYVPPISAGQVVKAIDLTSALRACSSMGHSPTITWWTDCQFVPFDDSKLLTCIGLHTGQGQRFPMNLPACSTNGVINIWCLDKHKRGCTAIQRKTSLRQPHCQMLPDGKYVCYLETSGVIMRNITDTREYYRREAFFKYGVYRFCCMSPDELHISVIMQIKSTFHLYVFSTLYFYSYKEVSCHEVFPSFPTSSNSYGNEHVECLFSPDSQYIAISTSMGQLFVVKRQGLSLYRGVIPGIVGKDVELVSTRSYDFDPRFKHEVLAFCTSDWVLHAFNLNNGTLLWEETLPDGFGNPQCVKYNQNGTMISVAGSEAKIALLSGSNGDYLSVLDCAVQCIHYAMNVQPSTGTYPTILRMSFTHDSSHMAMASTDGLVRIWKLPVFLSLQSLCRLKILQCVRANKVHKLPLPPKLKSFIICSPTR